VTEVCRGGETTRNSTLTEVHGSTLSPDHLGLYVAIAGKSERGTFAGCTVWFCLKSKQVNLKRFNRRKIYVFKGHTGSPVEAEEATRGASTALRTERGGKESETGRISTVNPKIPQDQREEGWQAKERSVGLIKRRTICRAGRRKGLVGQALAGRLTAGGVVGSNSYPSSEFWASAIQKICQVPGSVLPLPK